MSEQDKDQGSSRSQPCADASALAPGAPQSVAKLATPGPWVVIPPEPYDGDDPDLEGSFYYPGGIEGADGNPVCTFGWSGGSGAMFENPANPHLIAAAPEMRSALRFILAFYEPGQTYLDTNAWKQAEASARRALAKADGAFGRQDGQLRDEHND